MMGAEGKYKLGLNYVKATDFYPLAFSSEGDVTEAAFVDRILTKNVTYSKVEWYKLSGTQLIIKNKAFKTENRDMNIVNIHLSELGMEIPLTDVSEWNDINVTSMSRMFYKCSSLISLPDISKWNTKNVTSMYIRCFLTVLH